MTALLPLDMGWQGEGKPAGDAGSACGADPRRLKALCRHLERAAGIGHRHRRELFRTFVDMVLYSYAHPFAPADDEWLRLTAGMGKGKDSIYWHLCEASALLLEEASAGWGDLIGGAFEELEISNDRAGQFFTPWPVCSLMAQMTYDRGDGDRGRTPANPIMVNDPACGSGRMLLALASCYPPEAIFGGYVVLTGQDIDELCVKMAKINLQSRWVAQAMATAALEVRRLAEQAARMEKLFALLRDPALGGALGAPGPATGEPGEPGGATAGAAAPAPGPGVPTGEALAPPPIITVGRQATLWG